MKPAAPVTTIFMGRSRLSRSLAILLISPDHGGRVGGGEDRRAGHDDVRSVTDQVRQVVQIDPAVDLDGDVELFFPDPGFERPDLLRKAGGDEFLASPAGIDGHEEDEIELAEDLLQQVDGCRGIEGQAGLAAQFLDERDVLVEMGGGLQVEGDPVGPGLMEEGDEGARLLDHEMDVQGQGGLVLQGGHELGAQGQVGDEVSVHDVDMDEVGPGLLGDLRRPRRCG